MTAIRMATTISVSPGQTIRPLSEADVSEAAELLGAGFGVSDPLSWTTALDLPPGGFRSWMLYDYLPKQVAGGLGSLVAVGPSGTLAGVLTMEDMVAPEDGDRDPDEPDARGSGYAALEAMMAQCKQLFWAEFAARVSADPAYQSTTGRLAYVGFVSVGAEFRRQSVATSLAERSVVEMRAAQFEFAVVICSNFRSAKTFAKSGFQRWGGVPYSEFQHPPGAYPFITLEPDECCIMVKRLM